MHMKILVTWGPDIAWFRSQVTIPQSWRVSVRLNTYEMQKIKVIVNAVSLVFEIFKDMKKLVFCPSFSTKCENGQTIKRGRIISSNRHVIFCAYTHTRAHTHKHAHKHTHTHMHTHITHTHTHKHKLPFFEICIRTFASNLLDMYL